MSVTASAPGKVILFGEHAVVYGEPAIAGAIDKRIYVTVEARQDDKVEVLSGAELNDGYPYVLKACERVFAYLGRSSGLTIRIRSEFPPASGLGSSAAVTVATIAAVSELLEGSIPKKEIADLAHKVEQDVQGAASITDTAVSAYGGILYVKPDLGVVEPLPNKNIQLVVGYTGKPGSTTEIVRTVKTLRNQHPEVVDNIIHCIGRITMLAKENLGNDLGGLMDLNNGLLEALGVGTFELSALIYGARASGAKGAKITGAGGGGCMIAYAPGREDAVSKVVEKGGCLAMLVNLGAEGVRIE